MNFQLMLEAFEEYRLMDVPSSALNGTIESLQQAFINSKEKAVLSFINEAVVGSMRFTVQDGSLYFFRVSVTPSARGMGVAKAMLCWLESYAQTNGILKMKFVCASLSKNAKLYESIGHLITEEEMMTNPNGFLVKTVVMEKFL